MLYHISEESNIKVFIPRKSEIYKDLPPVVWAIDKEHVVNYYFPRDCPRIIYRYSDIITEEDKIKFFQNTVSKTIITVEKKWYDVIIKTILFKYIFEENEFKLLDSIAGYYISENEIRPKYIKKIDDIMKLLLEQNIELRFTPNLYPLKKSILESSINDFSIIRFRNAEELNNYCG